MRSFFQLIRWPNLLIIAATQYLMLYAVLIPMLGHTYGIVDGDIIKVPGMELQMSSVQFLVLVLSTVFLTAAGYVINDYFDTKTDSLNRPQRVIVGKKISRRATMAIHLVFNVLGVGLGFYLAYSLDMFFLGFIFLLVSGLLWFYSTTYKRQFLIGNILVAFLTGLVPFMVVLFELPLIIKEYNDLLMEYNASIKPVIMWIGSFSFFAFLTTLIRELVKDMEDFEGDLAYGRRSLPVVAGLKVSRIVVSILVFICVLAILFVVYFYIRDMVTVIYMLLAIFLPLGIMLYKLWKAESSADYHIVSTLTKLVMLLGVSYSIVAYIIINQISFV